ncbi:Helicasea [Phytophthora megakarya]|uniref:Helicasea n=1 Tax=Phytophthora megakarya TaxID=4795 RepID=A0A225UNI8_9STRA|nr:Helicasea [Phytophthora megakarya]
MFRIEETIELQVNNSDTRTETERLVDAVNDVEGHSVYELFPTLFPDGMGGLTSIVNSEFRIHEYSLADNCCHLVKWHDRRFAIHGSFKFTLSAADTVWPDFFVACDPSLTLEDARHLNSKQRQEYLNHYPDIASRFFSRRFKAFFEHILCGRSKPLGEIEDYFWRVEFQRGGPPHIHALLWIKNAPDIIAMSETELGKLELTRFIDSHISVLTKSVTDLEKYQCTTCENGRTSDIDIIAFRPPSNDSDAWNSNLSHLIHRVQQHNCTTGSSCRKKGTSCRFGFPKERRDHTEVEVKRASDGTPLITVHLKRTSPSVNNYSPILLGSWGANMDIQLIGNAYGAAEYTAAYVSKSEPDRIRFKKVITDAVNRCRSNLPN